MRIQTIPKEWRKVKLGDLSTIKKGEQLNRTDMIDSGKYPALNGGIGPSGYTDSWNTEADTITISEGGNSCGYVNFNKQKFWCGGHCYAIIDIKENVNKLFLYQLLKSQQDKLMALRVGSGLPNIQKKSIVDFELLIPPIEEQNKIADILSNIDEDIKKVDQEIEKTEELKMGLMRELFKEEKRTQIKNVVFTNPQQINPRNNQKTEYNYIDIASVEESNIKEFKYFLGDEAPSRARRVVNTNDIIISMVRPNLRGVAYIDKKYNNFLCSTGFCVLRSKPSEIEPRFLYFLVSSFEFTNYLVKKARGSNYPAVNSSDIEEYKFNLPDIEK